MDLDPDPHVLEVELVAQEVEREFVEGQPTKIWTYNGAIPGPELHARRGDLLKVHFRNELPEPTTIHWHGVRLPNGQDGVPGVSQPEVQPGGTFDYEFTLPDAGLFWYHPHVDSSAQTGFGLYGAILVDEPDEPQGIGDELTLVLSDIGVEPDGTVADPNSGGEYLVPLFGREGNILLMNGKVQPVMQASAGRRQRWRVVNAAKSRYYQLAVADHTFLRIGGDGGLLAHPVVEPTLVLVPGERADVVFTPLGTAGDSLEVRWVPYNRGLGSVEFREEEVVLRQELVQGGPPSPALPEIGRTIEPIDPSGIEETTIDLWQQLYPDEDDKLVLGINGVPGADAAPLMAHLGDTQVWSVENATTFAHPFHLHGYFFQVLTVNGAAPSVVEWKDTVNIPIESKVRLGVRFDERPGMWMFHCHILDHAEAGMMGMVDVMQ